MARNRWPLRRPFWVWLHRWVGLALALVLVIVGLTGSLLAFYPELQRLANPHWYPDRAPATWLSPGELAARLETAEPRAKVNMVQLQAFEAATRVWVEPRTDPASGKPFDIDYEYVILDPATGAVLDRGRWAAIGDSWRQIVDFIYELHFNLSLGSFGAWLLGILAVAWTIDCFVGAYLTLPARRSGGRGFLARWRPAWKVKRGAGNYRLNFDLHRAGGLWLWVALLVFAWSSVYMNLSHNVYTWVTRTVMDYWPRWVLLVPKAEPVPTPALGWREAQAVADRLMADQARAKGFRTGPAVLLYYSAEHGSYTYEVRSTLDFTDRPRRYGVQVVFDGHSGALQHVMLPTGQHTGNTVSHWLHALHMGNVFGLPYRIFVCVLGIAIAALSVTGVVVWWHKLRARRGWRSRPRQGPLPSSQALLGQHPQSEGAFTDAR
jgi:uncharacterized iron-regulated membrane protein